MREGASPSRPFGPLRRAGHRRPLSRHTENTETAAASVGPAGEFARQALLVHLFPEAASVTRASDADRRSRRSGDAGRRSPRLGGPREAKGRAMRPSGHCVDAPPQAAEHRASDAPRFCGRAAGALARQLRFLGLKMEMLPRPTTGSRIFGIIHQSKTSDWKG